MNDQSRRDDALVDDILDRLVDVQRRRARLDAEEVELLAQLDAMPDSRTRNGTPAKDGVYEEVACALRWSVNLVASHMQTATVLVERLPRTLTMLHTGELTYRHAVEMADGARDLDAGAARDLESMVIDGATRLTAPELRRLVRRTAKQLDPHTDLEQHLAALLERRISSQPDSYGMCWVNSYLPADGAALVRTAVQSAADTMPRDARTADQRRADALVAICAGYLDGNTSLLHGHRPTVQVTVALSTLHGLDEQPAELAGHGPIPAAMARRIAADQTGTWRRLVTDSLGRLVDYGRTRYTPPRDLRDHVLAHDAVCTRPGCQRQSRYCEIDHHLAWADGGPTNVDNLGPGCPRDHHLKHDAGWSVQRCPDGATQWTSPTGRSYAKPPTTYPLDRTTEAVADADDPPPF